MNDLSYIEWFLISFGVLLAFPGALFVFCGCFGLLMLSLMSIKSLLTGGVRGFFLGLLGLSGASLVISLVVFLAAQYSPEEYPLAPLGVLVIVGVPSFWRMIESNREFGFRC